MLTKSAQVTWALFFGSAIFGSISQLYANTWGVALTCGVLLVGHVFYSKGEAIDQYKAGFIVVVLLFVYSMTMSLNTARSLFLASTYLFSFLLFLTLAEQHSKSQFKPSTTQMQSTSVIDISKIIILLFALANAALLFTQYVSSPVRSFGFFQDYGQSALFILLGFGLSYSLMRTRTWLKCLVALILFTGFFTTFSRAANFLLIIFLVNLWISSARVKKDTQLPYIFFAIAFAYIVVMTVPILMGSSTVNRDTVAEIANLNSRIFYWDAAVVAIKNNPIWGSGLGNFEFLGIKQILPFEVINSTHNDYLQVWVDLGVFWFVFFVFAVIYCVAYFFPYQAQRNIGKTTGNYNSDLGTIQSLLFKQWTAWSLLLCIALYMLINFLVHTFVFQLVFCVLIVDLMATKKSLKELISND